MKRRTWMVVIVVLVLTMYTIVIAPHLHLNAPHLHLNRAYHPPTGDMVLISEDNYDFEIWHDNARNTTCYRRAAALSCVKDWPKDMERSEH